MARDNSDYRTACPFWSMQAMKCQLCREGLFIPLNDHIEVYCQTRHYPQCPQFLLHSAKHRRANRLNRRKYERVAASHRVVLSELVQTQSPHVSPALGQVLSCRSLDLSKGGIRLASEQPL